MSEMADFPGNKPTEADIVSLEAKFGLVLAIFFVDQFEPENGECLLFKLPSVGQFNTMVNKIAADSSQSGTLQSQFGGDLLVWPEPKVMEERVLKRFPGAYSLLADEASKIARGVVSKLAKKAAI